MSAVRETALAAQRAGLGVLPPKQDGSKRPDVPSWAEYQRRLPTQDEFDRWYGPPSTRTGLGYVCGRVSGGLELFEFDDAETYARFRDLVADHGLSEAWERLIAGYFECTPGGGYHVLWRTGVPGPNTVLARRPGASHREPLIETRGEGGYAVVAPSNGAVHPSGGAYELLSGGVATIETITGDERETWLSLARMLDEMPAEPFECSVPIGAVGRRPGDQYNAKMTWDELLSGYGWTLVKRQGQESHWRRPGKDHGISATTNYKGSGVLKVFSTSTPLDASKTYTPFGFYTVMEHAGDFTAAARALAQQGFGESQTTLNASNRASARSDPRETTEEREKTTSPFAVPPFPLETLPDPIRAFVTSAATAIGCPSDFVAVPVLGLAEGTIGKSRRLVIRPGFEVSPGSWYGIVAEPGTGKSPALKYAMRLVSPLQDDAWERYQEHLEAWEATPNDERGEKPVPEHFFVTDSTGEALWAALASSAGVTQVEDELRRRLKALDAYRQAGDRQAMLALWSNAPVKIVRRTSMPIYIPFPVAPMVGGIQPGVVRHLRGEGDDADADDGWLPRFMLCWPHAEPLQLSDEAFDARTLGPAIEVFRSLRLDSVEPEDIPLSPAAYAQFKSWHADNRLAQLASQGVERQWAAKAPIHLARLALVLHQLAGPTAHRELAAKTMADAIDLLEYFRGHLSRVLPAFGASARTGTQSRIFRILRSAKAEAPPGWISRSEIGDALRTVRPGELTAVLEKLLLDGVVKRDVRKTATKPSEWWRLVSDTGEASGREDSDYSGFPPDEAVQRHETPPRTRENPNNPNPQSGSAEELAHVSSIHETVTAEDPPNASPLHVLENDHPAPASKRDEPLQETFL